jgi:hypothetical protein
MAGRGFMQTEKSNNRSATGCAVTTGLPTKITFKAEGETEPQQGGSVPIK